MSEFEYTVVKDTKEKSGYYFPPFDNCKGMVERALKTGDYTIEGLEDQICIERKGCIEELALNLGQDKERFMAEIERMKKFPNKFLILEFTIDEVLNFPEGSRIPAEKKKRIKIKGKYLMKVLMEFQVYDNIQVMFCGDRHNAFIVVNSLLKRLSEKYSTGRDE